MPQFDAETIVEPIKVKLEPYVKGFGWTVVDEPTDGRIGTFLKGLKELMSESQKEMGVSEDIDTSDVDQTLKALDSLEPDKFVEFAERMAELHADLCNGTPSKVQMLAVPLRRRMHLYNYLQEAVLSPEAASGAGNGQVSVLPSRAAV